MEISAKMVNELRAKTGAGMMDCKKALEKAAGNMENAIDELRKSGIAKAEKKADRAVKDGLVIAVIQGKVAVQVEVLCETDFVAKTDKFRAFAKTIADQALAMSADGDITPALAESCKTQLNEMIATIGENMQIRRAVRWVASTGSFTSYSHMGGKLGVLVEVEGEADSAVISDIGMHIAAFNPSYIVPADIPADVIAREQEVAAGQVVGKPANIVENIVKGKINKWYSDVCLMKQPWLRDDKSCLEKVAPKLKVKRFVRWQLGA
jgi:elongation factor Ts